MSKEKKIDNDYAIYVHVEGDEVDADIVRAAQDMYKALTKVEGAIYVAFAAGAEERENGDANRQSKLAEVYELILTEVQAALAKAEGKT